MKTKNSKWRERETHLKTRLQELPRKLRLDALALAQVFFWRKSRKLRLCDSYLVKLWECSRATVHRRLQALEDAGIIRRWTGNPQKRNGKFSQLRYIYLLSPKKVKSKLVSHSGSPDNKRGTLLTKNQPDGRVREPVMSFADYLSLRDEVPLGAWMFWMRRWGAEHKSLGYLRKTIWDKVKRRADILEQILWDADEAKFSGKQKVGFIVSEIHARV